MTNPQQRPRKRSSAIALTGLMAGAAISISACEQPQSGQTWADRDPKSDTTVEASAFNSVADCNAAGTFTAEQCNTAFTQAQAESARNAPQFADQQSCEERFGVAQCVPRTSQDGGSVFTPLLTGFIVGQALSNLGGPRGAPMYRDRDGGFVSGGGYPIQRDYVSGRTRVSNESFNAPTRAAPTRVQSRSSVISRGGFGGWGGGGYGG